MQPMPSRVPPMLPTHAPQLGPPYSLDPLDCAPQPPPILTSVPPLPAQTALPPAPLPMPPMPLPIQQTTAPILQSALPQPKVSALQAVSQ